MRANSDEVPIGRWKWNRTGAEGEGNRNGRQLLFSA